MLNRRPATRTANPPTTGADGVLVVDKPAGVSSHDVVALARRSLGEKRIGHGGTLDPFATGLLVLFAGRATRLIQYVRDDPKRYEAELRFGTETDTEDLLGAVIRAAPLPSRAALEAALPAFVGEIDQVPSTYSAKRVDGRRAYDLARKGVAVVLKPARVTVHELRLYDFEGTADAVTSCRLYLSCGGGTYVRALARDLAIAAGSAAHLTALRRTQAGIFSVVGAVTLDDLREERAVLSPPVMALRGYPQQDISAAEIALVVRGIDVEAREPGEFAALVDQSAAGTLVAFAERRHAEQGDRWQPRVVMREVPPA
jgi:tRNA pseudouridine55 synthase